MWESFLEQFVAQQPVEWFAVITAILYLVLISRENPWGWFWGILSCVAWAYSAYFLYALFQDALLQIFYVGVSFWGLFQWKYGSEEKKELPISWLTWKEHLLVIAGGAVSTVVAGWYFANYTEAAAPFWDALTTVFSVIITFMVVYKKIDNWLYWIVIDSIYVFLYWSRGGYLFSVLFVVYLVIVVLGYFRWQKMYAEQLVGSEGR